MMRRESLAAPRTARRTMTIGPAAALTCLMLTRFNVLPGKERAAASVTVKVKVGLWRIIMIINMVESR